MNNSNQEINLILIQLSYKSNINSYLHHCNNKLKYRLEYKCIFVNHLDYNPQFKMYLFKNIKHSNILI